MNLRNPKPDEEIAIVFTSQIKVTDDGYAVVVETMNTPFIGDHARQRAERFRDSEQDRDFTEADGWYWRVWSNTAANQAYSDDVLAAMGLSDD